MDAFPAFFPLAGRTVVIAGDGEAAEGRARLFDGSPAKVVRLNGAEALRPESYAGAMLTFVAGGDDGFIEGAARAARTAGTLVNVADRPGLCDFITPAVIDRGAVVAAVGSGGAAPLLSAMLRNDIEARVPQGAGRVAALLGEAQDEVRHALPDLPRRRAFLRRAIDGPAARAAMDGDMERARRLLLDALAGADEPVASRIVLIDGDGSSDLLSLRAARALGRADVLVADDGCAPETLGLARRDARRLAPTEATAATLADLIGEGSQIVWLTTTSTRADALRQLGELGATIEVLRSASNG